jgi:shikimate dehydrogenase
MRKFGLIGFPLTHSFSRQYFTEKFQREGLTGCIYENYPIPRIEQFRDLIQDSQLEGLNVTIPYKRSVIPFLDNTEELPIPACNCIRIRQGKTTGFNTDIRGFEISLKEQLDPSHNQALILGNGGAAEAVRYVLKRLGIGFETVSRELHDGSTLLYEQLNREIIENHLLIINATPLGMYPRLDSCPPIPYEWIHEGHYLYDLIYNPEITLFLQKGKEKGAIIRNGLHMLKLQAEEGWKIWNA